MNAPNFEEKRKHVRSQNRYKDSDGKRLIEVKVRSAQQLFDARDPAPFRERDLDDDFVEYIDSSIREFAISTPLKIQIAIDEPEAEQLKGEAITEAVFAYFNFRTDLQRRDLHEHLRRAYLFLAIGLVVLGSCIGIAQTLSVPEPPGAIGVLKEGLVIFGWVSVWKPIELFLFDWYPLYEKLRVSKKVLSTEIQVHFT